MLQRTRFALMLVALVAAVVATAQPAPFVWRPVVAGVEHTQFTRSTAASDPSVGPWSVNALRLDLSQVRLDVVHALDEAVGLETVSSIAERRGAIAAVNGGYFRTAGSFRGDSTGTLQIDGTLLSEPDRGRMAVGLVRSDSGTRLIFGHVDWEGVVDVGGKKRALEGLNRARGANEVILFTPGFHRTTLTDPSGTEVVVRSGRVSQIREGAGSTPIPADGSVISATGAARQWASTELRRGRKVGLSLRLKPVDPSPTNPWLKAEDILAAGPRLVAAGRVDVTDARERMLPTFASDLHPRTAIASLADGRALLLVVDGRQPTISVGMSLDQLARLLLEFGAVEAMNLDGGGSTVMVVQGKVVSHPSDPTGERPVSDAIIVLPR
jgi:exopolysaccharide biosynthesis protein